MIFTVAIFDAVGQNGEDSVGVNSVVLLPGSVPGLNSLKPLKPISPSGHASRPLPPAGFTRTPSGNATVMSFTLELARPPAFSLTSWGTRTCTLRPVEVLACCTSGATSMNGLKGRSLQPVSATVWPKLSCSVYSLRGSAMLFGSAPGLAFNGHELPSTFAANGVAQDVGSVKNGGGWLCEEGLHVAPWLA